jgi:CheY-like chemotaxis protein
MSTAQRLRIVVADDNYVVARCLTFLLKKEGHECRAVADGQSALDAVRAEHPDLLVLDLEMPRLDGFEVCREIRRDPDLASTHVLILTAKGQPFVTTWQRLLPADGFMLKPFDPRALLAYVRERVATRPTDSQDLVTSGAS